MQAYRYLIAAGISLITVLSLAAALSILLDPYEFHGTPRIEGLNAKKPEADTHVELHKRLQLSRRQPQTILFGNSRVDVGFDPARDALQAFPQPVYNAGLPGAGMAKVLSNFRFSLAHADPAVVFLGVDFLDFLFDGSGAAIAPGASVPGQEGLDAGARRFARTTLSLTAVADSIRTLVAQSNPNAATITPAGHTPLNQYRDYVRVEGQYAITLQRNLENMRVYVRKPRRTVSPSGVPAPAYDQLRRFLELAAAKGVRVYVFTFPYHADILEAFHLTRLWPAFEDWKRRLNELVNAARTANPSLEVELWDFAAYNRITRETVPPPEQKAIGMQWYWEAGHFKAALGEVVVRRLHGAASEYSDVGMEITRDNLEARLAEVRRARQRYVAENGSAVARIRAVHRRVAPTVQDSCIDCWALHRNR